MNRKLLLWLLLFVFVVSSFRGGTPVSIASTQKKVDWNKIQNQSLFFTENKGQWDSSVNFIANVPFGQIGFGQGAIYYHQIGKESGNVVRISFSNANQCTPVGIEPLPGYYNYFNGNDSKKWITNVHNYKQVVYREIYDGIDLYYSLMDSFPKYEFHIKPYADPNLIRVKVEGGVLQANTKDNSLIISTSLGEITDQNLKVFTSNSEKTVPSCFGTVENTFFFTIGDYDRSQVLIIDPILYSTFLGGNWTDLAYGQTIDQKGNVYLTGYTRSWNPFFPTTPGAYSRITDPSSDSVFVSKINTNNTSLEFSSFINGSKEDAGFGIKLDSVGNVIVYGQTGSANFPTTPGAFDRSYNGGTTPYFSDLFVTKLNPSGTALIFSTFIGGSDSDQVYMNPGGHGTSGLMVLDSDNSMFLISTTKSSDFPVTPGTISGSHQNPGGFDIAICHLSNDGRLMISSTLLGGSLEETSPSITLNHQGELIVSGHTNSPNFPVTADAMIPFYTAPNSLFLSIINKSLTAILYSSFFGYDLELTKSPILQIDSSDRIFLLGTICGTGRIPMVPGAYQPLPRSASGGDKDIFVAIITESGKTLLHATYYGDTSGESGMDMKVDSSGYVNVVGYSYQNSRLKTTNDAISRTNKGGDDAFYVRFSPDLSTLNYATYLGGTLDDKGYSLDIDPYGYVYVSGSTLSPDLSMPAPGYNHEWSGNYEVFLYKIAINFSADYNRIKLQWNDSIEKANTIIGYAIYRSIDGAPFPAQPYQVVPSKTYQFSDQNFPDADFFQYQVFGIDANNLEIPATPLMYYKSPSIPTNCMATPADRAISLSWDPSIRGTSAVGGYYIYRSEKTDFSESKLIGSSAYSSNFFLDETTIPHLTYYYKVSTFDNSGVKSYQSTIFSGFALILTPVLILSPDINKKEFTTGDKILMKMDIINQGDRTATITILTLEFPILIDFTATDAGLQVKEKGQTVTISVGNIPANSKKTVNLTCIVRGKVSNDTKTGIDFLTTCDEGSTNERSIVFVVKTKKTNNTSVSISVSTTNLQQDPITGKSYLNLDDDLIINYEVSGGAPPYRVKINWGDGTSTEVSIDKYGNLSGQLKHKYSSRGTVVVKIKIEDASGQSKNSDFEMEIR